MPSETFLHKNFTECVMTEDQECSFQSGDLIKNYGYHTILHFCGHDEVCRRFNSSEALKRAKANVEKSYPVVGITENMTMTLTVAEFVMPQYFKGARKYAQKLRPQNTNLEKPQVHQSIKDILADKFSLEIEFYEFCKQRLYAQYEAIPKPFRHKK